MADKFVLLLEFSSGIIEPLPLSTEALADDRIVIAIDELKERVWLWQGASTSLVEQRAAQRKARSIVSAGYQIGPYRIGRDVSNIEIIEGDILDDPEVKTQYDQLHHTLSQKFTISDGVLGRFGGTPSPAPVAAEVPPPAPTPTTTPPPQPEPKLTPVTPQPETTTEPVASKPKRDIDDLGVIRVGILLSSILDQFSMCYVSTTKIEEGTRYTIEDPNGIICQIDVTNGSVHFLQRYDFQGKRKEILALLRDRLAAADL